MVIFGIVLVALSLVGLGWFIGVKVERHMYTKEGTPSASHNTGSPKLPTLEETQRDVVDAQLCAHGQVEVSILVKWVYDYICRQLRAGA